MGTQLQAQSFEETADSRLAGTVPLLARQALIGSETRYPCQVTTAAFEHVRQDGIDGIDDAEEVDAHQAFHVGGVEGIDIAGNTDAGVGDEKIDGAEFGGEAVNRLDNRDAVANIGNGMSA